MKFMLLSVFLDYECSNSTCNLPILSVVYSINFLKERNLIYKTRFFIDGNNPKKERLQWADISKGIAILLMVLGHLSIPHFLRNMIFSFHMPLFFIISGYFIRSFSFSLNVKKGIKQLIVPYTVACGLSLFMAEWQYILPLKRIQFSMSTFLDIVRQYCISWIYGISFTSTMFKNIMSVLVVWFLVCLFFSKLIFALVGSVSRNKYWLFGMSVLISWGGYYIGHKIGFLPYSFDVAMFSVLYLFFGWYMATYHGSYKFDFQVNIIDGELKEKLIFLFFVIIWIIGLKTGGIELAVRKYPYYPLCLLTSIAGSMLVFYLAGTLNRIKICYDILAFFGKYSLAVLIIHLLEMRFVNWDVFLPGVIWWKMYVLRLTLIMSLLVMWLVFKETVYGPIHKQIIKSSLLN